ncbi:hypothetical protein D9756_005017 [Leucocoprinus leucothites]|uniref:F-box domain-containing protein n=1 Tax=Leucocoprinus leucothites TaxID=201217 RepID=A0A8H5LKW2_9AGAR|nr:hypothetical protein D9756_005017 [Leucoagaricus leucothites]
MSLDFSWFADDMVLEILGHLPALDIIRYRRVCRRIYLASKERSVWVNVFLRSECPLPPVDLEKAPTEKLERILVRTEIIYAKWTGARLTNPRAQRKELSHHRAYCIMPPYLVVRETHESGGIKLVWLYLADPRQRMGEHITSFGWGSCQHFEPESGILYIAEVQEQAEDDQRKIKIVQYEVTGKDNSISKTLEHDMELPNASSADIPSLRIQGGYLIIGVDHSQSIHLVHITSGKMVICPTQGINAITPWGHFTNLHLTTSHLIQVDNHQRSLSVFKLPSAQELSGPGSILLKKTHHGSFPHIFNETCVYHRSDTSFFVVGTTEEGHLYEEGARTHVYLLIVDLDEYSSACHIHEHDEYNVAGHKMYFSLAPCSAISRSTLGILGVQVPPPTHTPSGRRIARRTRGFEPYYLGVKVAFGREGYEKPSISLTQIDLLDAEAYQTGKRVESINYFDPYAGQIILHERNAQDTLANCVILDYVSP